MVLYILFSFSAVFSRSQTDKYSLHEFFSICVSTIVFIKNPIFKIKYTSLKKLFGDFPGDPVVNPSANAADMGSIPDLGRSHMLWGN